MSEIRNEQGKFVKGHRSVRPFKKRLVVKCLGCPTTFYAYPSSIKIGYKKYCSKKCANDALRYSHTNAGSFIKGVTKFPERANSVEKECLICKKVFSIRASHAHKRKTCGRPCGNKYKSLFGRKGEQLHNWRGGITSENRKQRARFRKVLQKQVFLRDNYSCQKCGNGGDLQVDHIKSWVDFPELRFDINNCRTLCSGCHYFITFGKPKPPHVRKWGHNLGKVSL